MNHTLSRTVLYFFAACFLAWSIFSPNGAMAASTTINDNASGSYTGLYGNDGTATVPADDTNASSNTLILGNGTTGPTITDTSAVTVAGGYAPGNSNGDSSNNKLAINSGTSLTATGYTNIYGGRVQTGSGGVVHNAVTVNGFTQSGGNVVVYGGRAHGSGNASENEVTIDSGNTNDFYGIYGAYANSGNATKNTVTINGGGQIAFVTGGYSASGNAGGYNAGNVVNIIGGSANILNGIGGGDNNNSSSSGVASYNVVHIGSGYIGTIGGDVYGGWVTGGSGNAEHNSVTIAGGTLQGSAAVIGGHSTNGAAAGNTVSISGGRVAGDIRGGSTTYGSATGNTVSITTTGETYLNIYGGYTMGSINGDLFTGNTLNLDAGNAVSSVRNMEILNFTSGGNAGINTLDTTPTGASGNPKVTLNTDMYTIDFGGVINGTGGIEKTGTGTLTLNGTSTYSGGTTVSAGMLQIGNGGTTGSITGNITNNANVAFNRSDAVTFDGIISGTGSLTKTGAGTLTLSGANTYGGGTTVNAGTLAGNIAANTNLTVAGGATYDGTGAARTVNALNGAGGITNGNGLTAQSGSFSGVISGTGSLTKTGSGTLALTGTNNYSGGTTVSAGTLAGNASSLQGIIANNAAVEFNQTGAGTYAGIMSGSGSLTKTGTGTLTLSGTNTYSGGTTVSAGTLAGNIAANTNLTVAGGAAYDGTGAARTVNALNGSGNIINGNGLTAQSGAFSGVISGTGGIEKTGTGTLTLSGTNTFTGPLSIDTGGLTLGTGGSLAAQRLSLGAGTIFDYSSATAYASTSPAALKNLTVNGVGASIIPAAGGADFTNATILFNIPQSALASDVLLSINGDAAIDANTQVALAYPAGRPDLNQGEYLKLLDVSGTLNPNGVTQLTVQTIGGDTFTIEVDPMNPGVLQAIISTISPTGPAYERLKAYAENRAVSLAFANQGLDFILNRGFGSALAATSGQGSRFGSFGGLGGGWSRYNTGSHVDVSGMSLLAGLAFGNDIARGRLTFGAFFEGGWGNYDSHNSFSNAASVGGKGDTSYHGGGVLGRYELTQGALSGLYFDASARMGRAETDFRSGDIQYNGWKADFESSALYYGLHGGLGYVWMIPGLDGKGSLDLSAKLLWTRQEGDSLTVYQDRLRFKDADSLRTRLGGRFAYSVNEYVSPYLGAYWEHEFDGKLRASVNGQSLSSPSLRGDTGMGELGLSLKPSQSLPLSFDLGVQGYMGKREGVTGSLQIKFEF